MIGRQNRFHSRGHIQRLYRNGKSVRAGALALRYAPNPQASSYRLAVVVSRKISKSAVVRNRIRRRLYEHVRILSGSFTAPYDIALLVYDEKLATLPVDKLAAEVNQLFRRAKLTSARPPSHAIVEARKNT